MSFISNKSISLIGINIPILYTILQHTFQITNVEGSSMSPSINPTQGTRTRVLLSKIGNFKGNPRKSLKIGDIVYFRSPSNPEKVVVKRVKGFEGDKIAVRENSKAYNMAGVQVLQVPTSHIWVEGDNSFHSLDSNSFGPISLGLVEAKVVCEIDFGKFPFFFGIKSGGREARIGLDG